LHFCILAKKVAIPEDNMGKPRNTAVIPKYTMVLPKKTAVVLRDTEVLLGILWYMSVSFSNTTVFFSIGQKNSMFHIYGIILSSKVSQTFDAVSQFIEKRSKKDRVEDQVPLRG